MEEKTRNLQRHLWLLRLPGLVAAVLVIAGLAEADLWLRVESTLVACVLLSLVFVPVASVARLPVPELSTINLVQLSLYVIAGVVELAALWLLLTLVVNKKASEAE